jgi:hypothetical protein
LRGIINSLDYIKSIGMNAIWMTPIFDSHAGQPREGGGIDLRLDATGYYTRNYFQIDPRFGTLADAQELVTKAHDKGLYVLFDGVFGHHKGNLIPSPTGKLPVNSSPGVADYNAPQTLEFYKEVATYWINQLGIDGWRLDQSYQVPPSAWREIRSEVEAASAQRAQAGQQWGTLGYMVAEDWSDAWTIANRTFGSDTNPSLHSACDFPVRYAIVGVVAGEESGLSGRPASVISESWAYGAHDNVYAGHALPNLMLGNHDLVRFGDLLQRADIQPRRLRMAPAVVGCKPRLARRLDPRHLHAVMMCEGQSLVDDRASVERRAPHYKLQRPLRQWRKLETRNEAYGFVRDPDDFSRVRHPREDRRESSTPLGRHVRKDGRLQHNQARIGWRLVYDPLDIVHEISPND